MPGCPRGRPGFFFGPVHRFVVKGHNDHADKKEKSSPPNGIFLEKAKQKKKQKDVAGFPIVGMGASAGGLETLKAFFSIMPPDSNMAFVIIQHLSPQHESIMASLLNKHTRMNVEEIVDGQKIKPDHVYLNPPGKNVTVFNQRLHLMDPVKNTFNMPIDFFFKALSEDQSEKAIGRNPWGQGHQRRRRYGDGPGARYRKVRRHAQKCH